MASFRPVRRGSKLGDLPFTGAVGDELGKLFHLEQAPALITRNFHTAHMAVTEIRADDPVLGLTEPVPEEDAYLVCLIVKEAFRHEVWENGRPFPRHSFKPGDFQLRDLRRGQAALIDQPHHSLHVYIPRAALDELADDVEAKRIDEMRYHPGVPLNDPVISALGACLQEKFKSPEPANPLFIEHIVTAFCLHIAEKFGALKALAKPPKGGLTRHQEKRAQELLRLSHINPVSLKDIAKECGISSRHLSRAFKTTTGFAPHQWVTQQRVELAMSTLRDRRLTLSEVALICGFADQSHFTRVFSKITGSSPGSWRHRECE